MREPSVTTTRVRFPVALVLLGAAVALLYVGCGSDEPTATSTPVVAPTAAEDTEGERAAWEIEWEETIRKGQEEGELIINGGSATRRARPVYDRFQEIFGINVFAQGGDSGPVIDRIIAEREAGRYTVDLWQSGLTSMLGRLAPQGLLSPMADYFILPEVKDPSLWYEGRHQFADPDGFVFKFAANAQAQYTNARYNTELVSPEEYESITSIWDFVDPKWDGKIISQPPSTVGTSVAEIYFIPGLGVEWIEEFVKRDVFYVTEEQVIVDAMLQGEYALCLLCNGPASRLDALVPIGAPIGNFAGKEDWKDPIALGGGGSHATIALANPPANPNAATVFLNWHLSREGQTTIHQVIGDPAINIYPVPTLRLDVTDWGNTDPDARRVPGLEYFSPERNPDFDLVEGAAQFRRIWEAKYGRS